MKKRIHINQFNIRRNIKSNEDSPVITVKTYKENIYGHSVEIEGSSKVVYPSKKLNCGARVWIETESNVKIFDRENKLIGEL